MGPEDSPADDGQPTKEQWDEYVAGMPTMLSSNEAERLSSVIQTQLADAMEQRDKARVEAMRLREELARMHTNLREYESRVNADRESGLRVIEWLRADLQQQKDANLKLAERAASNSEALSQAAERKRHIITFERVCEVIADSSLFSVNDLHDLTDSTNADSDEGAEWLPYYKLSLAMLMQAFGEAETVAESLARQGSREQAVLARATRKAKASCRPCGIGPDLSPERAAEVDAELSADWPRMTMGSVEETLRQTIDRLEAENRKLRGGLQEVIRGTS